jgi:hypothetical protein
MRKRWCHALKLILNLKTLHQTQNNFTSFEGYINIGFKYMDNYSKIDVYQFNNIEVVCYEKDFISLRTNDDLKRF